MRLIVEKNYYPFGNLIFHLSGCEDYEKIFKTLWAIATHFAVVNSSIPVVFGDGSTSKKKNKFFKKAFDEFPLLKKSRCEMYWVNEWPGTLSSKYDRLLIIGKNSPESYCDFFHHSHSIFWRGAGSWDDLMLFVNNKLLFYCCTHEKFGAIFGNQEIFARLGLTQFSNCPNSIWTIRGLQMQTEAVNILLSEHE